MKLTFPLFVFLPHPECSCALIDALMVAYMVEMIRKWWLLSGASPLSVPLRRTRLNMCSADINGADTVEETQHTSCTESQSVILGSYWAPCERNNLFHADIKGEFFFFRPVCHWCSETGRQIGVWIWCVNKAQVALIFQWIEGLRQQKPWLSMSVNRKDVWVKESVRLSYFQVVKMFLVLSNNTVSHVSFD